MKIALSVNHVIKLYKKKKVISDLSFDLKKGSVFGLLGPNGSGKTTLIRIMTGIINPDKGHVEIDGLLVNEFPIEIKKKIGVVPDSDDLFDDLTAVEFLRFICAMRKLPFKKIEHHVKEWLQIFNIWDSRNQLLGTFSHGMRKKIQMVSALLHQPHILIIDEPTNGLDPDMVIVFKTIITKLKMKGITVVLSTHNLSFAQEICDDVCLIKNGQSIAQGDILKVLNENHSNTLEEAYIELTKTDHKGGEISAILADW